MKKNFKGILMLLLCISIILNICFVSTIFYKQDRIDRVLKYSNLGTAETVNIILEDLNEKLIKADQNKLDDRSYVIDTLEDTYFELFLCQLTLEKMRLINDNYNFDTTALSHYIFELNKSYKVSKEGLTDMDKKTLIEITNIHLDTSVEGFYEQDFTLGKKNPKECFRKPYMKIENICNEAIKELKQRH